MAQELIYKAANLTSQDASEYNTVQLPEYGAYSLIRVTYKTTSGSGATFQIRLGKSASFTLDSVDEFYTGTASVAVADQINDMMNFPTPFVTDTNGRVYLHTAYNAGADNAASYVLWFRREVLR